MFLVVYRINQSRLENFKVNVSNASPNRIAWIMDKELIASKPLVVMLVLPATTQQTTLYHHSASKNNSVITKL